MMSVAQKVTPIAQRPTFLPLGMKTFSSADASLAQRVVSIAQNKAHGSESEICASKGDIHKLK
jgi:hypothetical protein